MTTTEASRDVVFTEIDGMLRQVLAELGVDDVEITEQTSFNEDLELESIEFVTLADRMRVTYGDKVDFVGFLAEMDVDKVINMQVGEVVRFIADSLRAGVGA